MVSMEQLMAWLGRASNDAEVQEFLAEQGLQRAPKIPRTEAGVYLSLEAQGFGLLFESEEYFSMHHVYHSKTGMPVLAAVFFYGPGNDTFQAFQGDLYGGLRFDMSQQQAQHQLGQSALLDLEFNTEAWDIGEHVRLFLDYDDDRRRAISLVQATYFSPDR